LMQENNKQT